VIARLGPALLIALAGCAPVKERIYTRCDVLSGSGWSARAVTDQGGERTLLVTGWLTLPTPGYGVALERGPLLDLVPPTQQLILRTTPPSGVAAQVITRRQVRMTVPASRRAQALVVRCGDGVIAEIPVIAADE
jgi:hypothetical protein